MTEDNTLRACVDCKAFSSGDDGNSCSKYKKFDTVYGWEGQSAFLLRQAGGDCGITGKGWEERAKPDDNIGWTVGGLLALIGLAFIAKEFFS